MGELSLQLAAAQPERWFKASARPGTPDQMRSDIEKKVAIKSVTLAQPRIWFSNEAKLELDLPPGQV